jgi:hypothetical protein
MTAAAVKVQTAAATAAMAARTGTAVLPRPGSSASRAPVTAVGGTLADARAPATREGRPAGAGSATPRAVAGARLARQVATAADAATSAMTANAPGTSTVRSAEIPG